MVRLPMSDVGVDVSQRRSPGRVHRARPVGAAQFPHHFGDDAEEGGEHPARNREAFVVHRLGLHEMIRVAALADEIEDPLDYFHQHLTLDGVVSVARKEFAQLRFTREEQRIDARREVATALAGKLEARLDRGGDAHSPHAVRHATG